jgi:hypothetical protein
MRHLGRCQFTGAERAITVLSLVGACAAAVAYVVEHGHL